MTTLRAMPVLAVRDVATSTQFYETLGFSSHGAWGDPPGFNIVQRGDATLALDRHEGKIPQNQWWSAYVYVDDIEALHKEFSDLGVNGLTEVSKPDHYGCWDFDVIDPDGHRISFGMSLNPVPGPGLNDDRGRG